LAKELVELLNSMDNRVRMGTLARQMSKPKATAAIVDELVAMARANG